MFGAASRVHNLSSLLDVVQRQIDREPNGDGVQLSLEDILALIGRRAYGPLLLILGLISVSPATVIPGSTWAVAGLTLVIAVQMALHKEHPWMPRKALAMRLSEQTLAKFIKGARPAARFIDKIIRPRWTFLSEGPWAIGVAMFCALAALVTFPLGLIPLGPIAPGLAIAFFGLGLTAKDGLMLSIGVALAAGALWFVGGAALAHA